MKKYIPKLAVGIFLMWIAYSYQRQRTPLTVAPPSNAYTQNIDIDADGTMEQIIIQENPTNKLYLSKMYAQTSGKQVYQVPSGLVETIKTPSKDSFAVHTLSTEYADAFSFDFIAGTHHTDRMFFALRSDTILPVCKVDIPEGPTDCLFFSGIAFNTPTLDIDGNGFVEVIELSYEYPERVRLTDEEYKAISDGFSSLDQQTIEQATEIAEREKGGQGNAVVWAIYSFNGVYFEEKIGNEYTQLFKQIPDSLVPNKISRQELSMDTINYLTLVQKFWTGR